VRERSGEERMPTYSVVIPVFNSHDIVGATVADVVAFFEQRGDPFEVILVEDGGTDGSWEVIRDLAEADPRLVAVRFVRNYGQHNANLAGLEEARGEWVVTMDDDGQNPPSEIEHLVAKAAEGHDVVFGRFDRKKGSLTRRIGTRLMGWMNRRLFGKPKDLVVSNFRLLRRDVVERITTSGNTYPYITGQALLYGASPAHADVRHLPRAGGQSTYDLRKIVSLVLRILFSYSPAPLHVMAVFGSLVAFGSFVVGAVYLVHGIVVGSNVEGWTTVVVLLAFLNGVAILMLSMLGEYLIRTLRQVTDRRSFHVAERVDGRS
jgi:glycosyltransferase involved in cell wall biosynthesis